MNAADAFVRVAACDDEARDLCIDLIVEIGEEVRRKLCTALGLQVHHLWGKCKALLLTSMRRLDRLSQCICCSLSGFVIPLRISFPWSVNPTLTWSSLGAELVDYAVQLSRRDCLLRHLDCFT